MDPADQQGHLGRGPENHVSVGTGAASSSSAGVNDFRRQALSEDTPRQWYEKMQEQLTQAMRGELNWMEMANIGTFITNRFHSVLTILAQMEASCRLIYV